jgi:hypothetical protein
MWKTWDEIKEISANREVVFYGRSEDWIPRSLPFVKPSYIVDSNPDIWGKRYFDFLVKNPEHLRENHLMPFVIITTGDYLNVSNYLESLGLRSGLDFTPCPEYYDFKYLEKLRDKKFKILISSSDYKSGKATRTSFFGGGLFVLEKDGVEPILEKKVDGQYRQICLFENNIAAVENNKAKVHIFDNDFNLEYEFDLDRPHCCGLDRCDDGNFYVTNASTDQVYIYNNSGELIHKFDFGILSGDSASSAYHINDLCVHGDYIYISYFSKSGFWRNNIFDGGVSVFTKDGSKIGELYSGLWQPHSPRMIDGNLHILDSSNGKFIRDSIQVSGEFPGFVRGLDHSESLFFIGQSETMYTSRKTNLSKNIMNNSGVYVFDNKSKASRFYATYGICNIHDLRVLS